MRSKGSQSRWESGLAVLIACLLLVSPIMLSGCSGGHFRVSGAGYYPPGSTYTTAWDFKTILYVETPDPGSMFDVQDKHVWVRVEDRDGNRLLNDRLDFSSRLVEGRCTWDDFDNLEVRLYEVTNDESYEYQDVAVEPHAPHAQLLQQLTYRYDTSAEKFVRVR